MFNRNEKLPKYDYVLIKSESLTHENAHTERQKFLLNHRGNS